MPSCYAAVSHDTRPSYCLRSAVPTPQSFLGRIVAASLSRDNIRHASMRYNTCILARGAPCLLLLSAVGGASAFGLLLGNNGRGGGGSFPHVLNFL